MMDVREKLVELLGSCAIEESITIEPVAGSRLVDFLVNHGVTVQEWISVNDRLPEPKENAICINRHGDMMIGTYTEWGWMFPCYYGKPTHWMPLPEPPKEE